MSNSAESIAVGDVQIRRMYSMTKIILAVLLAPLVLAATVFLTFGIGSFAVGLFGNSDGKATPQRATTSTTIR